ncbi:hypothetical protein EVAR_86202_1 [Eumeta japonica]|uniref:Uncharacterized protein n=1 Tax=Eumeta variegata TaxID=151549 RepID=A0A4C1UCH5_EUMVA|nr:hypothetical protein EVAR_86202_1 [Eumeta japonica]
MCVDRRPLHRDFDLKLIEFRLTSDEFTHHASAAAAEGPAVQASMASRIRTCTQDGTRSMDKYILAFLRSPPRNLTSMGGLFTTVCRTGYNEPNGNTHKMISLSTTAIRNKISTGARYVTTSSCGQSGAGAGPGLGNGEHYPAPDSRDADAGPRASRRGSGGGAYQILYSLNSIYPELRVDAARRVGGGFDRPAVAVVYISSVRSVYRYDL